VPQTLNYTSPPERRFPAPVWPTVASAIAAVAALGVLALARSGASQPPSEATPLARHIAHLLTLYVALPATVLGLLLLWPGFRRGPRAWAWWLALELNTVALVWATVQLL
jgi:hypothetical protein